MNLVNLFILRSNSFIMKPANPTRKLITIVLWTVFYLTMIDIVVNLIFSYPVDSQNINPSRFQMYFEYGRSVEGKFARMIKHTDNETAPIVFHGWLGSKKYRSLPDKPKNKNQTLIAVYGMSHTKLLGEAISKYNKKYIIRDVTAPGATPNWSFAAYQLDKNRHQAKVVILGIMTDSVAYVTATSGATAYFDMSYPYTFPRYFIANNQLRPIFPPFYSVESYRDYFYNNSQWSKYRDWLHKYDKYYDSMLFRSSILDKSCIIRILRRAYAETIKRRVISNVYNETGFNMKSEEVIIVRKIVREFAKSAREKHTLPIIYIINNQDRGDHLFNALKPILESNKIPYLSTHIICPPDNPRLFLRVNSHFIPSKDMELAQEIIKIIEKEKSNQL